MASEEVMNTIEKTLDTVEETIETVERIPRLRLNGTTRKQQIIILSTTAILSGISSGFLVHFFTKKAAKMRYEKIIEEELAEAKKFYSAMHKKDEYADPVSTLEKVASEASEEYRGKAEAPVQTESELIEDEPPVVVVHNIFASNASTSPASAITTDGFDYDAEMPNRKLGLPYVISEEEFMTNEADFVQSTMTYYEGDNVLADDRDQEVPDPDVTIGDKNLKRFGASSKDKNIVYVRNEKLEMDFEISRSGGEYAQEVLGIVEHSDQPSSKTVHRMRRANAAKFKASDDE